MVSIRSRVSGVSG
ncbi:hypothetical protein YPPY10_1591, partial [Yersinia pestis PY-10]